MNSTERLGLDVNRSFDYDQAEKLYTDTIQIAEEILKNNDSEGCIALLKTIIESGKLGPFVAGVYLHFSVIFDKRKDYKGNIELLNTMDSKILPDNVYSAMLALLGFSYMKEKRFHQAIQTFYIALDNNCPTNNIWNIHYDLGLCYGEIKNYVESKKHYQFSLENNPPEDKKNEIEIELMSIKIKSGIAKIVGFFK